MSAIRTYPAGTNGVIETDHRDVGPDGYIIDGAWVRITFEDTTGLCYPQTQLEHAAKEKAA